uniref:Transposase n=1 Tax=Quercus lobata TaxID=97700 RepID=A0A7N2LV31_QUELO
MPKKAKYTYNIPRYEMARLDRMRQNQEIIDALGLKHISTSLKDSAQFNCAKRKRSRVSVVVDDDYVPPIGDDENDIESSNSLIHKLQMAPGRRTRSRGSTSKNTRGTTRGIAVQALVDKSGKLPVRIAAEYDAPVGKNACKLVNQIGVQVRSNLSNYNVKNWKSVDAATRDVVIQSIADQFELEGDSNLVTKTINTKCGRLLSSGSNKLYQTYKKLVQSHGADYAKSHPPKNATLEQWIGLIEGRWTNKDWLEKSRINSENRRKTTGKHSCGTKALAVTVDEEINNNDGQVPELAKIYKDVHFNPNTNKWIHHEDEATYDRCQDPNAIPLTQEEISNLVFKKKSGIVKGLGMRPSSSLVTTASSSSSVEYIHRLESEIIELKEARAKDEEERAKEQEARAKQDEVQKNILNFLRSKGYDEAFTYGGGSSSS